MCVAQIAPIRHPGNLPVDNFVDGESSRINKFRKVSTVGCERLKTKQQKSALDAIRAFPKVRNRVAVFEILLGRRARAIRKQFRIARPDQY